MSKRTFHFVFLIISLLLGLSASSPLRESSADILEERATGDVRFYLYTAANPTIGQELIIGNLDSIKKSNFLKTRQTKIIIHGWGNSYLTTPNPKIRDAYFSKGDFNIISVDWAKYADLNYVSSRAKVPLVGEDCAQFIDFMHNNFALNLKMLVVIGHSLGAHVAGFCGKGVKSGKLDYIVGLDPAFPLYSYDNPETRLASTDANYVETIQTNGNTKGFLRPIGSAAFYPNWGRSQPGCGIDLDGTCAHARSVDYYAEAIRGYSFRPINQCASYTNIQDKIACTGVQATMDIGDPLSISRSNGIFYFETNSQAPFGHLINKNN